MLTLTEAEKERVRKRREANRLLNSWQAMYRAGQIQSAKDELNFICGRIIDTASILGDEEHKKTPDPAVLRDYRARLHTWLYSFVKVCELNRDKNLISKWRPPETEQEDDREKE